MEVVFNGGMMTISGCTITNNTVDTSGTDGGGVANTGAMTISGCTITNNTVNNAEGRAAVFPTTK